MAAPSFAAGSRQVTTIGHASLMSGSDVTRWDTSEAAEQGTWTRPAAESRETCTNRSLAGPIPMGAACQLRHGERTPVQLDSHEGHPPEV